MIQTWIGLLLALVALLGLSQRNLYLAMFAAGGLLGLLTLPLGEFGLLVAEVFRDPGVLLLAAVVAIIPLIGGGLERSGQMDELVRNLRIGRRAFLAFSPALLGMLPMPGGALLSAPLVERGGGGLDGPTKVAVNVWFRHILYLVYPLGPALIASAKVAGLEVYWVIPYLFPSFLLSAFLGWWFLLRRIDGPDRAEAGGGSASSAGVRTRYEGAFSLKGLFTPIGIILAAPVIDLLLKGLPGWLGLGSWRVGELGTLIGVSTSLLLVAVLGRLGPGELGRIGRKMGIWRFALIILGMFFFLGVFQRSGAPELLANLALPPAVLCVAVGFLLGLVTGRIQAPAAIIIPVLAASGGTITPAVFAVIFYSTFLGYVLTPVHPCISVSAEYFRASIAGFLRKLALPTALALLVTGVAAIFIC